MRKIFDTTEHSDNYSQGFWKKYGKDILVYLILLSAAVVMYRSSLKSDLISDDYYLIGTDLDGSNRSFPLSLFYQMSPMYVRPLPLLVWRVQYLLFGLNGLPSHLINVFFHAGNAFLLYLLLSRVKVARFIAIIASLLFVFTPVSSEIVSWSSGRFDGMSLFFILLAIMLFMVYLDHASIVAFVGSMLSAVLALFSKEAAVSLVILFPSLVILFGKQGGSWGKFNAQKREFSVRPAAGLIIFFVIFFVYISIRSAILGGIGGQYNAYGVPHIHSTVATARTLLAPLSSFEFSQSRIKLLALYVIMLLLLSAFFVLRRWKVTPSASRRMWIFFVIFFGASLVPAFWSIFVIGVMNDMEESRFLYAPTLGFIGIMVLGLLEFGWRNRTWQIAATVALVLLIPVYYKGVQYNSHVWDKEATIVGNIAGETRKLLPDPAHDSILYLQNAPKQVGVWYYGSGLDYAVRLNYGRQDLTVQLVDAGPDSPELADGYLFIYENGQLRFIRGPAARSE